MRLSDGTLASLPNDMARPRYDRTRLRTGIVHLGIGAFHRAHQAAYVDNLLALGDLRWGIVGASLRSASVRDQLVPQNGLYTLVEREGADERLRLIGAVRDVIVAPEAPDRLIRAMADPDVHIVTLTVTEKGYKLDPATGALLLDDPDIASDLAASGMIRTTPGILVAALAERRHRDLVPFTVLSCDNLSENGERVRRAVLAFAEAVDPALGDWIAEHGAFPATMIDRIVPATTDDDIERLSHRIGVRDLGMVKTEPFTQWVIEDRFAGERPDFAQVGVQMTNDVRPWEEAKLRLLNGAHSAIAYLGALSGAEFIHEALDRPGFGAFIDRLWDEAQTTLSPPPSLDVAAYRAQLMARFSNSALQHRTRQIAMDGSQKLPQRLLASAQARLRTGHSIEALSLAVAGWIRWQLGRDETGRPFTVDDPLAARTRALVDRAGGNPSTLAAALLSLTDVFPSTVASNPRFGEAVSRWLSVLLTQGAARAVEQCVGVNNA